MTNRKFRIKEALVYGLIYIAAAISVLLLVGIILYVFSKGVSSVNWNFLTTVTSVGKNTVGIAGNIVKIERISN